MARAQTRTADAHRDRGEWSAAARHYRRALDLVPGRADLWVQYGHALKESGHVGQAVTAYQEAARLAPTVADTQLQLGHAFKLQGRTEDAVAAYVRALSLAPGLSDARAELERLGHAPDGQPLPPPPIAGADEDGAEDAEAEPRPSPAPPTHWLPPPPGGADPDRAPPAVLALLARHHLLPHILRQFDAEYYTERQGLPNRPGAARLLAAVEHFCTTGLGACAPVNERCWFDAAFYNETYKNDFPMTVADAYRHWLNFGLREGRMPNLTVWIQDVLGLDLRGIEQVDLARCCAASPELAEMPVTLALEWLADGGLLDGRLDGALSPDGLALYAACAVRATRRGEAELALAFLERVLAQEPDRQPTLEQYADRLVDTGRPFPATTFYRQVLDTGQAGRWTHTHLAVCLARQRRFREAYEVLAAGVRAFPEYVGLRTSLGDALDEYFAATVRDYDVLARVDRVAEGQALVTGFCDVVTVPLFADRLPPRPIRSVALFSLMDLPQCRFYRVDQKVEQLERAGFAVSLYDSNTGLAAFLAEIRQFEAVIFYRLAPLRPVVAAMAAARRMGLVTFYEIDDLLFLASEYPGTLEGYAGQISRETFTMLAMGVPLFLSAMRMCDYALASTPTLAREMAPFVGRARAFVHRNGMGSDHERYLDYVPAVRAAGEPVVLFYGSGTRAHKQDFQELMEPALIEIARRHGDRVAFVMVGWLPISDAFRTAAHSLTLVEPVFDLHEYWDLLKEADINLAVLKPSLNVDAKSEIKWMEAGLFGIPSVVSRTATYAEVIEDGRTGFLCDTVADWVRALDRLVRDPALRRRVGLAAQAVVRRDYRIDVMGENLRTILDAVSPEPAPRRPKVLVVNVFYAPQTYGGATRVMHDNLLYLSREHGGEFEFEVFTCVDEAPEDYVVESYAQDGIAVTGVTRSVAGEQMAELSDPRMEALFRRHLAVVQPDMVHFHCIQRLSLGVVAATRAMGIPYVITVHDAWWISDNQFLLDADGVERTYDYAHPKRVLADQGQKAFARMQGLRPALMGARAVLSVSEPFSALHRRCGVPNVRTVANGVSPLPPCPRTMAADGRVRLGHVGGMTRHKGYALLKQVLLAGRFAHLHLLVVDHGQPRSHTHEELWGTTPVTVVGKRAQAEVAALYAGIDVVLAPSTWSESFGLVTREAAACGCWVVASDRGAIGGDVTDGVNGFVVDVSNGRGLTRALQRIDADPARYCTPPPPTTLRTADEQGDELAEVYRQVLGG